MKSAVVLMGDIIKSQGAGDLKKLHQRFNKSIEESNRNCLQFLRSPLTITLGDEFQGIVTSLFEGFKIAMDLRMNLLQQGIGIRLVLGLIHLETPLNRDKAWNMMGPGLGEARSRLNNKGDTNAYRFSIPSDAKVEISLNGLGHSLTGLEERWTETQRRYVFHILKSEKTKSDISKELGISENSLYKSLRSAEFQFYLQQKYAIEEVLEILDREKGFM